MLKSELEERNNYLETERYNLEIDLKNAKQEIKSLKDLVEIKDSELKTILLNLVSMQFKEIVKVKRPDGIEEELIIIPKLDAKEPHFRGMR